MNLELHILQSFAPSNLNRDDTGSPKDCDFGGSRRARVSSQCWKRAIRMELEKQGGIHGASLAVRTRRIANFVADQLAEDHGKDVTQAKLVVDAALSAVGLGAGKSGDSQYLLFVPKSVLGKLSELCLQNWDLLADLPVSEPKKGTTKAEKKGPPKLGTEITKSLEVLFESGTAVDLALFGRMIADRPNDNVAAASQVAHAISTHKVDLEFDFYTAVDDLQPDGETGAGMMGTVEYNAACFYRYSNLDLAQLKMNLNGNLELAADAVGAFLRSSIAAIPSGKQNSMAALNPPSLVLVVLRKSGFWSLANAFLKPVRATSQHDLMDASINALTEYWTKLQAMYGAPAGLWSAASTLHPEAAQGFVLDGGVLSCEQLIGKAVGLCREAIQS